MSLGEVRLEVPASPEFFRIVRIMVSGVASRLGFTIDELEDLTIAVDELCFALVGRGVHGVLRLRYEMLDDSLAVEGTGHFEPVPTSEPHLSPMSGQILAAVLDECEVSLGPAGPRFRMVKRRRGL